MVVEVVVVSHVLCLCFMVVMELETHVKRSHCLLAILQKTCRRQCSHLLRPTESQKQLKLTSVQSVKRFSGSSVFFLPFFPSRLTLALLRCFKFSFTPTLGAPFEQVTMVASTSAAFTEPLFCGNFSRNRLLHASPNRICPSKKRLCNLQQPPRIRSHHGPLRANVDASVFAAVSSPTTSRDFLMSQQRFSNICGLPSQPDGGRSTTFSLSDLAEQRHLVVQGVAGADLFSHGKVPRR